MYHYEDPREVKPQEYDKDYCRRVRKYLKGQAKAHRVISVVDIWRNKPSVFMDYKLTNKIMIKKPNELDLYKFAKK